MAKWSTLAGEVTYFLVLALSIIGALYAFYRLVFAWKVAC